MAVTAFISYSHADTTHLERLHKNMAQLLRDGVFETWTDHAIVPGPNLDNEVFAASPSSQVFIALFSPDYLGSNCRVAGAVWGVARQVRHPGREQGA